MSDSQVLASMPWQKTEAASFNHELNHYAIIDSLLVPTIKEWAYQDQTLHEVEIQPLFKNTLFNDNADQGPFIMNLHPEGTLIEQLNDVLTSTPAGCLISSQASFEDLYQHCQSKLIVSSGEDANQALLRFYDPRNLAVFLGALSEIDRSLWMGHLEEIQWFHHGWHSLKQDPSDEVTDYHLTLTQTLKETMQRLQVALQDARFQG
ncbi:hypothetical protein OA92_08125 [Marinomonas sp. SBI22]|uniref:DUF4123 domain-containing protein n=1 Tax=unclassified Marinomonas TaxID=196814 RepID=UPI0007AF4632|nr:MULTISPECIES: DUF4123 domain-containing protein [unclassified Marinomonas]KZM43648.1 hypothetical protein OA92_08125 [Marinomonas sp. SBI22]